MVSMVLKDFLQLLQVYVVVTASAGIESLLSHVPGGLELFLTVGHLEHMVLQELRQVLHGRAVKARPGGPRPTSQLHLLMGKIYHGS